jgi:hypothetical protein
MPRADQVPEDLKPLVRCQAVELRDSRWDADVRDLVKAVAKISGRRKRRAIAAIVWAPVALAVMAGVALIPWVVSRKSADSTDASFMRVYYEDFDYPDPQKLPGRRLRSGSPAHMGTGR